MDVSDSVVRKIWKILDKGKNSILFFLLRIIPIKKGANLLCVVFILSNVLRETIISSFDVVFSSYDHVHLCRLRDVDITRQDYPGHLELSFQSINDN